MAQDKDLSSLKHVVKEIQGGGEVIVLDTGSVIDSEAEAMLQALHSRSVGGLKHHLEVLEKRGASNFMKNFYVGYGHKSIGDCGSVTIFVEGVSLLCAKAIQDSKLYSGQEASTRYVDFSEQVLINPLGTEEGNKILESQRQFYLSQLEPLNEYLKEIHPISQGEKEGVYNKAIAARAFDILRGFLPAGASTNLAWHSNLRQVSDKLLFLRNHPLEEIRNVADAIENAVLEMYPNSFTTQRFENTEEYQKEIAKDYFYFDENCPEFEFKADLDKVQFERFKGLFDKRPFKTELPKFLSSIGRVESKFLLDFGSFRDLQRHRALEQRMPLLTTKLGFNRFYLDSLHPQGQQEAKLFLEELEEELSELNVSEEELQYYVPIGYNTSNYVVADLPSVVYLVELRATRFVHQTLREIAKKMAVEIEDLGIKLHLDDEPDRFDVKRGEHDIVMK